LADQYGLLDHYKRVRRQTMRLAQSLSAEDMSAQSMPDASPGKWHFAHTSWFFETFILQQFDPKFRWFRDEFNFLFNSYYDSVGSRHARPIRGLLTRPSLQEVIEYREHVDTRMEALLGRDPDGIEALVTIGLHHEMQHQELFLTDLLNLLSHNPMYPAVISGGADKTPQSESTALGYEMFSFGGGLVDVGASNTGTESWSGFSYDCEQPTHQTFLTPFRMSSRLVNNQDWMDFMADGGYENPLLWLSDGWAFKQRENWSAPLYWVQNQDTWQQFSLAGLRDINPYSPVVHVSYFEADAFARWQGKRLPREHEWENVAANYPIQGNFLESQLWSPLPGRYDTMAFEDLFGDVWEWTQSAFCAYPGFTSKQGALGEYNGKFMSNQYVLKGGSCATPKLQMRRTYRNFFYPHQRWQFTGVRLAEDN